MSLITSERMVVRFRIRREVHQVLEANEKGRPYRGAFYGLLAGAGAVLISDPTRQLHGAGPVRWVWSGFILCGTLISLWGVARDRWRIEWYGLPLQMSALFGLAVILVVGGGTTSRIAFSLIIAAFLPVLVHRFVALNRLAKASKKMNQLEAQDE